MDTSFWPFQPSFQATIVTTYPYYIRATITTGWSQTPHDFQLVACGGVNVFIKVFQRVVRTTDRVTLSFALAGTRIAFRTSQDGWKSQSVDPAKRLIREPIPVPPSRA